MNCLKRNKSVLIRKKIIHLNTSNNKKSLLKNKTSTSNLNGIPNTNGSKLINNSYFHQIPEFYNNPNYQKQIYLLLTKINNKNRHINIRNASLTSLKKNLKINLFDKLGNINLSKFKNNKTNYSYDLYSNSSNKNNIKLPKTSKESSLSRDFGQKNNNLEYLYRNIFSNAILFKPKPRYIDNKLNLVYSENESQYKLLIEKRSKLMNERGIFLKFDEDSKKIKKRVNDIKDKIKFMKSIMDYSYPTFMITKIKAWGRQLQKNKTEEKLTPFEEQKNIIKNRNILRTKYLQKNLQVFPIIIQA
jgi:hypothetical protein